MSECNVTDDVIIRWTGDDYPHPLLLSVRKAGETEKTPLDLSLATSINWYYKKADASVVNYLCTKDADNTSGIIYIPFDATGTDVSVAGKFEYYVRIVWAANGKKQTAKISQFILNQNII